MCLYHSRKKLIVEIEERGKQVCGGQCEKSRNMFRVAEKMIVVYVGRAE